jgi:hypothetical protein
VPLAVQQPVDEVLQAVPGRCEPDGDDRGRQQAAAQPDPLAQQPLGQLDHPDVHTDPTGGQQPIDQGAVEQQVDVVQAVPQDRDADRGVHGRGQHGEEDRVPEAAGPHGGEQVQDEEAEQ